MDAYTLAKRLAVDFQKLASFFAIDEPAFTGKKTFAVMTGHVSLFFLFETFDNEFPKQVTDMVMPCGRWQRKSDAVILDRGSNDGRMRLPLYAALP